MRTKCDYCDNPSVGYVSRLFQGPFYCEEHQERAETETAKQMHHLEEAEEQWRAEQKNIESGTE